MANPITVVQQGVGIVQSVSNTVQGISSALGALGTGSFWGQLRPASYKGIPFAVFGSDATIARKNAVHDYPLRDGAWVEDMGAAAPRVHIHGFLIGDDCIAQRNALIRAMNAGGAGVLVHPTLGSLHPVSLAECTFTERMERGRVIEFDATFIDGIQRIYPTISANTPSVVSSAAAAAGGVTLATFAKTALGVAQAAVSVVQAVVNSALSYVKGVQGIVQNVTSIVHAVETLPGDLGRQFGALTSGFSSYSNVNTGSATLQTLQGQLAAGNVAVQSALQGVVTAAQNFSPSNPAAYAPAVQALTQAIASAAPTPRDAITALSAMATQPALPYTVPGSAAATVQAAQADLFRRSAVIALAQVSSQYQPSSATDAMQVRNQVTALLDAEISVAGDQGNDATYLALRTLRAAVVQDLNTRGAALPAVVTITTGTSMPSLALAQRLYRDPARADELVSEANPPHPAFMPTVFQGLAA